MSTIFSERMKNRKLVTAFGTFMFDSQGEAKVPEEHVGKLLTLKGYKLVGSESESSSDDEGTENFEESGAKQPEVIKSSTEEETPQNNDKNEIKAAEIVSDKEDTQDSDDSDKTEDDGVWTEEKLAAIKNVAQLKKIAKDNGIDLQGATKSDEIKAIIIGAFK